MTKPVDRKYETVVLHNKNTENDDDDEIPMVWGVEKPCHSERIWAEACHPFGPPLSHHASYGNSNGHGNAYHYLVLRREKQQGC